MNRQVHIGTTIVEDLWRVFGITLKFEDYYLAFYTYSEAILFDSDFLMYEKDMDRVNYYLTNYVFPLVDFTGHEENNLVIIQDFTPNDKKEDRDNLKIIYGLKYDPPAAEHRDFKAFEKWFKDNVISKISLKIDPENTNEHRICVVDFHYRLVTRIELMYNEE